MIHSLVLPIYNQIEGERKVRAQMEGQYSKLMKRIEFVEEIIGAQ